MNLLRDDEIGVTNEELIYFWTNSDCELEQSDVLIASMVEMGFHSEVSDRTAKLMMQWSACEPGELAQIYAHWAQVSLGLKDYNSIRSVDSAA